MKELLFMEPYFKQVIWGGHKMREKYGYLIPGNDTGEAWVVSTNRQGVSRIRGGTFNGWKLDELWRVHKELFGNPDLEEFPLLVKVIDANDHLSVQVHPGGTVRGKNTVKGKAECWYVLDCEEGADIVIGHHAASRQELEQMAGEGRWSELLNCFPIHKGDFFYTPPGTIHAIRRGTLILEIQQNSDVTYRLYDYGRPRELHVREGMDAVLCPCKDSVTPGDWAEKDGFSERLLIENEYFIVTHLKIKKIMDLDQKYGFLIVDVIEGNGTVDNMPLKPGDHFIAPSRYGKMRFRGELEIITSHLLGSVF